MKVLLISMAVGLALALWGADSHSGVDQVMAAGKLAGEHVYSMLR